MITAEEFFRSKLKELNPFQEVVTLNQELITAEQAMRWAQEFAKNIKQTGIKIPEETVENTSISLVCEAVIINN